MRKFIALIERMLKKRGIPVQITQEGSDTRQVAMSFAGSSTFIYAGLAISMLGIFPMLAVLGVIGDGPEEPVGIFFGLLFGAVFGGIGGWLLYRGLSKAMDASLDRPYGFFSGLLWLVWSRANRRTLYAAIPNLLLAVQIVYVMAVPEGLAWVAREDMRHLVLLEFFTIHSTAFLGLIAFISWRHWGGAALLAQMGIFSGLLGIYGLVAYQIIGLAGAIGLAVLILSKFIGYAVHPMTFRSKGRLVQRWLIGTVVFFVVSGFFNIDLESRDNLEFAATYFFILAMLELFGLIAADSEKPPASEDNGMLQEETNG